MDVFVPCYRYTDSSIEIMQAGNGKCIMCAAHTAHCACVHHAYVHHAHNALIHTASNGFNVIFQSTFSIALLDFQYAKAIISEMNVELFFFFLTFQWRKMMKMLVCCAIAEFCLWCEMKDNGCGKERKLTKKRERVRIKDGKRNNNSQNALDREKSRERKKWNSIRGTCSSLSYEKHETDREENLTYFGVFRLCSDLPNAESARLAHTWACDVESA